MKIRKCRQCRENTEVTPKGIFETGVCPQGHEYRETHPGFQREQMEETRERFRKMNEASRKYREAVWRYNNRIFDD